MEPGQAVQLEYIYGHVSIGVAILDSSSLRIRYANPYLRSLLAEPWNSQNIVGWSIDEVLPSTLYTVALPYLQQVAATGEPLHFAEVPYEGFLESKGRTYWRIAIERAPAELTQQATSTEPEPELNLLITIENVSETVRSRLQLKAIENISAVIASTTALPQVLDRILQSLSELVGATRCAILLTDHVGNDMTQGNMAEPAVRTARIVAHQRIHASSRDWNPVIDEHILLGRFKQDDHALIVTDTRMFPDLQLPNLDNHGTPWRPGSVLSVPIFEPHVANSNGGNRNPDRRSTDTVLGTIEVYHRRPRGFPAEEVALLESFAQQAGLAIYNARLFRKADLYAKAANRNAHQKENIMRAIPDGVVIYDPRWRIADANLAARKLFGWSDDIIGTFIIDALKQASSSLQADFLNLSNVVDELEYRALEGRIDEFKLTDGKGQTSTLRCSYTPIRDDLGDIFAFIIIYRNVTEEVAARERIEAQVVARTTELAQRNAALQQARAIQEQTSARMELMLQRLPSGVILVTEPNSAIAIINHRAVQLLQSMGLPLVPLDDLDTAQEKALGMDCEALLRQVKWYDISGSLLPYEDSPLYRAQNKGEANEAELHTTMLDGQTLHLLVNAAPLRRADGSISSTVLVMHNISKTKALEQARENFFTTMAHELKTPLANIRAHLSALLARDLQWSIEEQYDFLQTADEQVERLVGMINHFLDASRVEAGALRLELEPILLPELVEDLQERLEALITSSRRRFVVDIPPQLPAVVGDYELIMSVLTNLLSNAFRYAPEGDIVSLVAEPTYETGSALPDGVNIRVTDRGPGMTSELQKALFTRFSTFAAMDRPAADRPGQPTNERQRGSGRWSPATGLGLYISRGIIEAHGSKLTVKSSPGQGATFAFTLPVYVGKNGQEHEYQEAIL
jgi:PAS domain S-box-containing protein